MSSTVSQLRKSPLADNERALIAQVIGSAGFPTTAGNVWTIHHAISSSVLWVSLHDGRQLPFDFSQFKSELAAIKANSNAYNRRLVTV